MIELDPLVRIALEKARRGEFTECRFVGMGGGAGVCNFVVCAEAGRAVVLLSERDDNHGTSITNWFEQLATGIYHQHLTQLPPESITWLERYPADARIGAKETLDHVHMEWDGGVFKNPHWKYVEIDAQRGRVAAA